MGNEVTHVRIADLDRFCRVFEEGGADPEDASFTGSLISRLASRIESRDPIDPGWQALADFVEEMVNSDGPTQTWLLDLDRRFDRLASSMRRSVDGISAQQISQVSVFGEKEFVLRTPSRDQVARGCQGFAQRVSTAETCRSVAEFLAELSTEAVRDSADLGAMVKEGVYKAHGNHDADQVKSLVASDLDALRAFYREVAIAGHSVLITRD